MGAFDENRQLVCRPTTLLPRAGLPSTMCVPLGRGVAHLDRAGQRNANYDQPALDYLIIPEV
jgi:hypothetical protein